MLLEVHVCDSLAVSIGLGPLPLLLLYLFLSLCYIGFEVSPIDGGIVIIPCPTALEPPCHEELYVPMANGVATHKASEVVSENAGGPPKYPM